MSQKTCSTRNEMIRAAVRMKHKAADELEGKALNGLNTGNASEIMELSMITDIQAI